MTPFDNVYEQYLKVPDLFQDKLHEIYALGLHELALKITTDEKKKLLYKLL